MNWGRAAFPHSFVGTFSLSGVGERVDDAYQDQIGKRQALLAATAIRRPHPD